MKFDDVLDGRRSVRSFSSKKVSWSDVIEVIDCALKAPQAGNNILRFIIVEDNHTKGKLAEHSQQKWMADAPYIIVVCSDSRRLEENYDERGLIYAQQQAGAAVENFLLKAVDIGLSSCWVGAFADELVKKVLKIPSEVDVVALLPLGHGKGSVKKPKKTDIDKVLNWGKWGVGEKPTLIEDPETW